MSGEMIGPGEVERIAAGLTEAERVAIIFLPEPRHGDSHLRLSARPYGSLWRKASPHWTALLQLEEDELVERRVSCGETLWRLTRPIGLAVRDHLVRARNAVEGER